MFVWLGVCVCGSVWLFGLSAVCLFCFRLLGFGLCCVDLCVCLCACFPMRAVLNCAELSCFVVFSSVLVCCG